MVNEPPNPLINQGKPAFAQGGTPAKKGWAIAATVGFGIFWVCLLFSVAEIVSPRDLSIWPEVLCVLGLALGIFARVRLVRAERRARA